MEKTSVDYINSDKIMNGDIVRTSRGLCEVEIQGSYDTYMMIDDKCENIAIGNYGFLRILETSERYRARWEDLSVVKRKFPQFFQNERRRT